MLENGELLIKINNRRNEYACYFENDTSNYDLNDTFLFGSFLCMVGNLDVKTLMKNLEIIVQKFVDIYKGKSPYSISFEKLRNFYESLYPRINTLLQNDLLSLIICNEIHHKIRSLSYILNSSEILFPNYIYLEELQNICINIIHEQYDVLNADDFRLLSGDSIKLLIEYNDNNIPELYYRIQQIGDIIAFDASYYVKSDIKIKICENCGKYFIPTSRSDEIYCDNIFNKATGKTCKEIGYEIKLSKDVFRSAYRTAYKTQRARIKYNAHISDYEEKHFRPWDAAAKEALSEYQTQNDIKGFKDWLKTNKDNF